MIALKIRILQIISKKLEKEHRYINKNRNLKYSLFKAGEMIKVQERITIIMGIYNCAPTLERAINSILLQTYSKWKLVLCDDGSIDSTLDIARKYKKQYPEKIILIKNEKNMGLNVTLNRCLEYADTEYIARMDGDDISLPNRFKEEIDFLDTHPEYAIVSSPMIYFDDYGDFMRGKGRGEPALKDYAKGTPFCHAPCMCRSEAYRAVNGYVEKTNRLRVEDWDLWIRMREKGFRGYNLKDPLYKMYDDRNAFNRRKFKYRLNEASVIMMSVKKLNLLPSYYIYALRPIIVGILPKHVYRFLHTKKKRK